VYLITKRFILIVSKKVLKMIKPKKNNPSKLQDVNNDNASRLKNCKFVPKPTLYSSIIQTESKLKNITLSHLEPKPNTVKVCTKCVQVYIQLFVTVFFFF